MVDIIYNSKLLLLVVLFLLLLTFLVKLHAASLINMHLIIEGRTGIGKTSAAIYYAKKRGKDNNYIFHSFHVGTQPIHFYGTSSLNR